MIKLFIPIIPMGAVRTTRASKGWGTKSGIKYAAYKKQIGYLVKQHIHSPSERPISVDVTFYMPMLSSWSGKKKERMNGAIHKSKPDIDNLIKGCFDALNKIAWEDDNQVYEVNSRKMYSYNPGIGIEIWEMEEETKDDQQSKAKTSAAKTPHSSAKGSA
jgi:Holliday junction resolvase RusA-like endonuclease